MSRRSFEDWQHLVEEQIASELSVPKFCQQHQISPGYFYARKSMVGKESNNVGFIQANVITKQITSIETKPVSTIKLTTAAAELSLPRETSAQFLVELLSGLAS